jgi:MerR family transcriptional regulator, light-induced transcriptional regulator
VAVITPIHYSAQQAPDRHGLLGWLYANRQRLAARGAEVLSEPSPNPASRWARKARRDRERFVGRRLNELCVAVAARAPELFVDDIAWAKVALDARGADVDRLLECLVVLRSIIAGELTQTEYGAVGRVLDATVRAFDTLPTHLPSAIEPANEHAGLARAYLDEVCAHDVRRASALVLDAAQRGIPIHALYIDVLQVAQRELGRLWHTNRIGATEEEYGTAVTRHVMGLLRPRAGVPERLPRAGRTLVAMAVAGDPHELGPRMVADFFERAGWDSCFLGPHASTDWLLDAIVRRRADVVAISTALTRHVPTLAKSVAAIRGRAETAGVVVLVGGQPFNAAPDLWSAVGADGTASSAGDAVTIADCLVARRRADDA